MPSKYDAVLPSLPAFVSTDPQEVAHQEKVNALKRTLIDDPEVSKNPSDLAKEYADLRFAKDELEEQLKNIQLNLDTYAQMLIESNDSEAIEWGQYGAEKSTLRMVTGDTIRVQHEPYTSVKDKEANRLWAIKNGMERMLSLPWQTLNSISKECLQKGLPEPDGVKVWKKSKIVYTAAKGSK